MFDADAHAEEAGQGLEPFTFRWDSRDYELPHSKTLKEGHALRLRQGDFHEVVAEVASQDAADAILDMPVHTSSELAQSWFRDAGDEGKSPQKSSAPNRSARRSKQTSKSAASS